MKHLLLAAALSAAALPAAASTTVDLLQWKANDITGTTPGEWQVSSDGMFVEQKANVNPTVFFDPAGGALNTRLSGTVRVQQNVDDDYFGFVLGYSDGELNSASADFWLIDWKRGNQDLGVRGLRLAHVSGNLVGLDLSTNGQWWSGSGPEISTVQRGANLNRTSWIPLQTYTFDILFTATNITVTVNGLEELNYDGTFTDGGFGFYNNSQELVRYSAFTTQAAPPIPLPASLPLLAAGFGAIALMKRRKKAA